MDDLDLSDDCWTAPIGDISLGDVCEAIPLAVLHEDRIQQLAGPDDESGQFFVPVRHSYGLVVGLIDGYAVLAAIGTFAGVGNDDRFARLVESGRAARTHIRLPCIPDDSLGAWDGRDGVVMLSQVESFVVDYELLRRRVAAMTESAQEVVRRRIRRLLEP